MTVPARTTAVSIPVSPSERITGDVDVPAGAHGLVLFAHGSGSSRFSPRNRQVAHMLRDAGLGTVLMDLLTPEEERVDEVTRHLRFDTGLLTRRLVATIDWVHAQPTLGALPIGLFGASTGAAAALLAAAERPDTVAAVVSRGGRPDLASPRLAEVRAPTLLIVGGRDTQVIDMNRSALAQMKAERTLEIVPGATHLFEEPGALDRVARLARDWFVGQFAGVAGASH